MAPQPEVPGPPATAGDPEIRRKANGPRRRGPGGALEHDELHARIWGGLHFRDAMDDGYLLGHATAASVMTVVR